MTDDQSEINWKSFRDWAQFGILVFATTWGVYTFILKDIIWPASRPTALELKVTLDEIGRSRGLRMMRLQIVSANRTDRRVYIPAMWYRIEAYKIEKRKDVTSFWSDAQVAPPREITARHTRISDSQVVASARIYTGDEVWYEPHDVTTEEHIFAVPEDDYDYLVLHVHYIFTRDMLSSHQVEWYLKPNGSWEPNVVLPESLLDIGGGHNWSVSSYSFWPDGPQP